jgi:hypothetical protein
LVCIWPFAPFYELAFFETAYDQIEPINFWNWQPCQDRGSAIIKFLKDPIYAVPLSKIIKKSKTEKNITFSTNVLKKELILHSDQKISRTIFLNEKLDLVFFEKKVFFCSTANVRCNFLISIIDAFALRGKR